MTQVSSSVPRTAAARFWFGWTLVWNAVVTVVLGPLCVVALRIWPSSRTFSGWLRAWARAVFAGCGFRVRAASGIRPEGAVVYVANHQAMLDIPVLALAIPDPFVFVARSELRRLPLVGGIMEHSPCVFIDRKKPGGTEAGMAEAAGRLAEGHSILFFPEGTRSYDGRLGTFYPGAFRLAEHAGVPVLPVAIGGAHRLLNERRRVARPGRVEVRLGTAIAPGGDAEAMAEAARRAIGRMLEAMRPARDLAGTLSG